MNAKPSKSLLVNLTWAGALLSGLFVLYVGAYVTTFPMLGDEMIGPETFDALQGTVFLPMDRYTQSDLPGGRELGDWCQYFWGMGF